MVNDINVKIRLNIPEEDKQKIRQEAQALRDTGVAPIESTPADEGFGIFFEGRVDPGIKGFQGRKAIGGGVPQQRDRTSKQAVKRGNAIDALSDQIDEISSSVAAMENIFSKHIPSLIQGSQLLTSPANFIGDKVLRMLSGAGPYGIAAVGAITAIITLPEVIASIIKILAVKGGPLNRDWRRFIQDEISIGLTREQQKRRDLGLDQIIITQQRGFVPVNGALTANNLYRVDELRISRIGNEDKAYGVR